MLDFGVLAPGQHWWSCRYVDPKDLNKPVMGSRVYFSVFPSFHSATDSTGEVGPMAYSSTMAEHFIGYVRQNYKVTDLPGNPTGQYAGRDGGRCGRVSDDDAGRAYTIEMTQKQWASSTPPIEGIQVNFADIAAQDGASDAQRESAASAAPRPTAAPRVDHSSPARPREVRESTPISLASSGPRVQLAQHKRHYEGGGCSACGKTVETGWKDT
jgi:hypothetical protein